MMNAAAFLVVFFLVCHIGHCVFPPVSETDCPLGAYGNGNRCYISFNNAFSDFHQAQYTCEITGGQLATVSNAGEWRFLQSLTVFKNYYRYWIAINDKSTEGQWTSGDGNPLVFTNWHNGRPNGGSAIDCATIAPKFGFRWTDENCNGAFGYVCQFNNRASSCPTGRVAEGQFCFQSFEEKVTADTAIARCSQLGGFLADPKTEIEHNAVVRSIHINPSWKNLATLQISSFAFALPDFATPYIGIVRNTNGHGFINHDRTAAFTDFATNEPNNVGGAERCVNIQPSLKMHDVVCNGSNAFICQYNKADSGLSG